MPGAIEEAGGRSDVRAIMGIGGNEIRRRPATSLSLASGCRWCTPFTLVVPGTRLGTGAMLAPPAGG